MPSAIRLHRTGGPEVLTLENVEVPTPGPGQLAVRHTYAGLNFIDVYHRTGLYPLTLPLTLGDEAAGRVTAVGAGVRGFAVGDRIAYARATGAWCTERVLSADLAVHLPDAVSDQLAAAVLLKGMTAEYLVRRTVALRPGHVVLFHAAAGGTGLLACQWARALGARVIGAVSTPEKAALAKAHGCDAVVITQKRNFVTDVKALTDGKGVDVVYDSVGQATFEGSLACLKPRGMLVSFGQSSGRPPPLELGRLGGDRSLYVTRPSLGAYVSTRQELETCSAALFEVLEKGFVKPPPLRTVPLAQAAAAMAALEARRTTGSTVLEIDAALAATGRSSPGRATKAPRKSRSPAKKPPAKKKR